MGAIITAIFGFLGGLATPWVRHRVRAAADLHAARRSQIDAWRTAVERVNFNDERDRKRFTSSNAYSSLRQRMQPSVIERFEKDRTIYVGGGRGDDVRRHILLDEISRLEKEWKLL